MSFIFVLLAFVAASFLSLHTFQTCIVQNYGSAQLFLVAPTDGNSEIHLRASGTLFELDIDLKGAICIKVTARVS